MHENTDVLICSVSSLLNQTNCTFICERQTTEDTFVYMYLDVDWFENNS